MDKQRKIGYGNRYFDFERNVIFAGGEGVTPTRSLLPEEYRLENGCRVTYADTGEPVPHPLQVSELCGYVIRQVVDEIFDVPLVDEETGRPIKDFENRRCVVTPAECLAAAPPDSSSPTGKPTGEAAETAARRPRRPQDGDMRLF